MSTPKGAHFYTPSELNERHSTISVLRAHQHRIVSADRI